MKQVLIETFPFRVEPQSLYESFQKNDGRLIVPNMIIQRADTPNKNKRIYGRNILEREGQKLMESVHKSGARGILGELDHPESSIINLKNACLGVLDYRWKGNDMLGDIEILNTPSGNILKEIFNAGYVPGISSRGMGSVRDLNEGDDPDLVEVEDDFSLLCWDACSDPSTHNAYFKTVKSSMGEAVNYNYRNKYSIDEARSKSHNDKVNSIITEIICELSGVCCYK